MTDEIVIESGDGQRAVVSNVPARTQALTPMEMLSRAVENGQSIDVLDKLMGLQERYEANLGRKAFDAAISDAKSEIKPVTKNREGHNKKRYADLSAYVKEVDPILAKYGLSYRFRTSQNNAIQVTCILAHRDGHSEETTLSAAADTTGNKNSIQAIGSTLSYLQRYTLCAALGLAAEEDDDGQSSSGDEPISAEQLAAIQKKADETGADIPRLCKYFKIDALPDIRKSEYANVIAAIDAAAKKKATK